MFLCAGFYLRRRASASRPPRPSRAGGPGRGGRPHARGRARASPASARSSPRVGLLTAVSFGALEVGAAAPSPRTRARAPPRAPLITLWALGSADSAGSGTARDLARARSIGGFLIVLAPADARGGAARLRRLDRRDGARCCCCTGLALAPLATTEYALIERPRAGGHARPRPTRGRSSPPRSASGSGPRSRACSSSRRPSRGRSAAPRSRCGTGFLLGARWRAGRCRREPRSEA